VIIKGPIHRGEDRRAAAKPTGLVGGNVAREQKVAPPLAVERGGRAGWGGLSAATEVEGVKRGRERQKSPPPQSKSRTREYKVWADSSKNLCVQERVFWRYDCFITEGEKKWKGRGGSAR